MGNLNQFVDATTQKNIESWLNGDFDLQTKKEIMRLQEENPEELVNAFYAHLSFGTGGLRGIMGVGTNRMNICTVRAATQGFANYLIKKFPKKKSVLIGYDSRHHSREFAKQTAQVFAGNGIKVFIFKNLRPVSLISFGLIYKNCQAAVMITASHNPPEYNGYKAYWSNGAQVLPPNDSGIIDEVNQIISSSQIKLDSIDSALIEWIDEEVDIAYLKAIHSLQLYPKENTNEGSRLKIVYTSLHGAGITMIPRALEDWGFKNLFIVEEQKEPNGDFPTVESPNPEERSALKIGIEKLLENQADLLIGTDPDTDRMGVVVMHQGKAELLNGNQIACICLEHICFALTSLNKMPSNAICIKTIVTSELFKAIANHYSIHCLDVLTGFKYIGEKIDQWSKSKEYEFIFGGEESYGYLLGTHARDKDAVVSANLISEVALHLKLQGKTLIDFLFAIYQKHGIFREKLLSLTLKGKEGSEKIASIMQFLKTNPPSHLANCPIVKMENYENGTAINLLTHEVEQIPLPPSDVACFWLEDETKIVIRPSGTEPKIKIYCGAVSHLKDIDLGTRQCDELIDRYLTEIQKLF